MMSKYASTFSHPPSLWLWCKSGIVQHGSMTFPPWCGIFAIFATGRENGNDTSSTNLWLLKVLNTCIISEGLKVLISPTQEMIELLKKAGLGYRTGDADVDRIGDIPLRELVYRVHPLPPSLKPLIWDFGSMDKKTGTALLHFSFQILILNV